MTNTPQSPLTPFGQRMQDAYDARTHLRGDIPLFSIEEYVDFLFETDLECSVYNILHPMRQELSKIEGNVEDMMKYVAQRIANHVVDTGRDDLEGHYLDQIDQMQRSIDNLVAANNFASQQNQHLCSDNEQLQNTVDGLIAANASLHRQLHNIKNATWGQDEEQTASALTDASYWRQLAEQRREDIVKMQNRLVKKVLELGKEEQQADLARAEAHELHEQLLLATAEADRLYDILDNDDPLFDHRSYSYYDDLPF